MYSPTTYSPPARLVRMVILLGLLQSTCIQRIHAAATLKLDDGAGHVVTVHDGDPNDGLSGAGTVNFNGPVGGWLINVSTGISKPGRGCPWQPSLDLNTLHVSTGAGTLTVTFTDDGFIPPGVGGAVAFGSANGTQTGGSPNITLSLLQGTNVIQTMGPQTNTPFPVSFTNRPISTASNYPLTLKAVIVHTAGGTTSFDFSAGITNLDSTLNNCPPVLAPISNQVVNAGATLMITNMASDAESQIHTFSLDAGPSNATFSPATVPSNSAIASVFAWRASVSLANTTNLVTVRVTDNGNNPSNDTKSFNIIVNPMVGASVSQVTKTNSATKLLVNGDLGPDYTVQASTDLTNWTALLTTNSPTTPFSWSDTNADSFLRRFYRVLLGP